MRGCDPVRASLRVEYLRRAESPFVNCSSVVETESVCGVVYSLRGAAARGHGVFWPGLVSDRLERGKSGSKGEPRMATDQDVRLGGRSWRHGWVGRRSTEDDAGPHRRKVALVV